MSRKSAVVRAACRVVLALGVTASPAAYADCTPVLDAMLKAANQQRAAGFIVDDDKAAPVPGEEFVRIRIGNVSWTALDGRNFKRKEVPFPDLALYQPLADLDRDGRLGCETLGPAVYRGAPVIRYRYNNPVRTGPLPPEVLKQSGVTDDQVRKFVVYVEKASGLPVYSESFTPTGMKVGTAMVYGDAVKEPAAATDRKGK